jgi:hypothetical protein
MIPEDRNRTVEVFYKGGKIRIESLEIYELNSIWE